MKKMVMAFTLLVALMAGCNNQPSEESFKQDSNKLYTQIFKDGKQSEEVNAMYHDYMDEYEAYEDEELYQELDNLYNSLGKGDGKSSGYLTNVMNILNN